MEMWSRYVKCMIDLWLLQNFFALFRKQHSKFCGKIINFTLLQVRNKLDDRHYAIKRILLKPSQSQFNKKITREVKLLSRLNHENVVRSVGSTLLFSVLNVEQQSMNNDFVVFGLSRRGIEPESTVSAADALSTRPLQLIFSGH